MSNLEKEFDSVATEVQDKLQQAKKLINEALVLSKENHLSVDRDEVNSLLDSVYDLPTQLVHWSDSESNEDGAWSSSLGYRC